MENFEGITLQTTPFQETGFIIQLFTKEFGIHPFIYKQKKSAKKAPLSPLLKIEGLTKPSSKDLWPCYEIHILSSFQSIRLNMEKLKMASFFFSFLKKYIPQKTPSPFFYHLIDSHLTALNEAKSPFVIGSSFLLKFYASEGMLDKTCCPEEDTLLHNDVSLLCVMENMKSVFEKHAKGGT